MVVTSARLMDKSVDSNKVTDDAVKTIRLKVGQRFQVLDSDGFTLLNVINDSKKTNIRGTIGKP